MEIGSGELLREVRASVASIGDQRAQRHLAAIARLGDALRSAHEREPAARIACEVAVGALEADRAFLLIPDAAGRLVPVGSAIASDDPDGAHYEVSDVFDRVVQERKAIAFEPAAGESGRTSLAAPLSGADGEPSMRSRHLRPTGADLERDVARIIDLWHHCRGNFGNGGDFLFGAPSVADCFYAPVASRFRTYGVDLDEATGAYVAAIESWEPFAQWLRDAEDEPWIIEQRPDGTLESRTQ